MGNYATTTSISITLPNFLEGNTTTVDISATQTFSEYINWAEAEINSAVANKWSLPFSTVPPILRSLAFEIAAYYTIRAYGSRDWPNRNEMLDDFNKAFETLKKLEKGEIELTLTDGSLLAVSSDMYLSNRSSQDPVFELDDPVNWAVDKDRLDELDGSRG